MSVQIDEAGPADVSECARLLGRALGDDAVLHTIVRGGRRRDRRLVALYTASLRTGALASGALDVARTRAGGPVVGVASWVGPHGGTAAGRVRRRELARLVGAIGPTRFRAVRRVFREYEAHRPREPHWYLTDLGVDAGARGLGVGSALLGHRLAVIDAVDALPAYLEATTAGSRRLYERFGFRPVGELAVGGATVTAMVRAAHAS